MTKNKYIKNTRAIEHHKLLGKNYIQRRYKNRRPNITAMIRNALSTSAGRREMENDKGELEIIYMDTTLINTLHFLRDKTWSGNKS